MVVLAHVIKSVMGTLEVAAGVSLSQECMSCDSVCLVETWGRRDLGESSLARYRISGVRFESMSPLLPLVIQG